MAGGCSFTRHPENLKCITTSIRTLQAQNRANASEYITRTLEDNLPYIVDSPTYADYIATRPRAERIGSHGLFTSGNEPVVLSKVSQELNEHQGNVWAFIASLKREDAERLGYDNASRWKDMIYD